MVCRSLVALSAFVSSAGVVASGEPLPPTKNDTCPMPYPTLDYLKDSTIDSRAFKKEWPKNMAGTWYTVAVADRFQMPDQFRCTRYNYSIGIDGNPAHLDATYLSLNVTSGQWIKFHSIGTADLKTPGLYHEWTTAVVPKGSDPYEATWYDPIVHFGKTSLLGPEIFVRWGCTRPPLGNVQYMEINSRRSSTSWGAIMQAVLHLKNIGAPNIDNLVPVPHNDCEYPWTPEEHEEAVVV